MAIGITEMNPAFARSALFDLMAGGAVAEAINVAARLRLADSIADGELGLDEAARQTSAHRRSLYRLLRALASLGVFHEGAGRRFSNTELSNLLRHDVDGSLLEAALCLQRSGSSSRGDLFQSVMTGRPSFRGMSGDGFFDG